MLGLNVILTVLTDFINSVHELFLSQMLEWCNSYQYIVVTTWICLSVIMYLLLTITVKLSYKIYKNKYNGVQEILCKAIEQNRIVECVRLLEQHPECINKFVESGYTPFLVACANGHTQIVKIMLKKGADVKLKSFNQESAFYLATFYYIQRPMFKNATCIRELYYAGADINEANDKGLTPLQMAAMFGHTALVKWLLLKNASIKTVPNPYLIACSQGHIETANVIWKFGCSFALDYK